MPWWWRRPDSSANHGHADYTSMTKHRTQSARHSIRLYMYTTNCCVETMNESRSKGRRVSDTERERESKRINITKNTFPILMHLYGFLLLLYQNKNPTMQCFCFYMHHCGHCVRHLEGSYEFISEWKQKRNFRSVFWSSRSLILAHDFSRLSAKKTYYCILDIPFNQMQLQHRQHDESLKSFPKQIYTTQIKYNTKCESTEWTERTNEPNERNQWTNRSLVRTLETQISRASAKKTTITRQERRKKNCVYRTNITSYQTLDQWFYWAIFKRLSE